MIIRGAQTELTERAVRGALSEFRKDVLPRLKKLGKAYENQGPITTRRRAPGLPNNRLAHPTACYITTIASGYLAGRPVTYDSREQQEALDVLGKLYQACDMAAIDSELAADASIYGRGVMIVYMNEKSKPMAATLPPEEAFVVYDDTVAHTPMWGIHIHGRMDETGKKTGFLCEVYTEDEVVFFAGKDIAQLQYTGEKRPHYFGGLPMVEIWNNAKERGDFEPVLSLLEAYDVMESDRVNDKQQFTDALLLLTGCVLEEEEDREDKRTPAQKLMEEKVLSLPDSDAKAEWLVKQADETGAEVLKNALRTDIHKLSMVPDLSDENFAANASGVAMRYKLFGLEQLVSVKERWFREGLRARLRLYAHMMQVLALGTLDPDAVQITFTRSLPVNETEIAAMVAQLTGIVSQRTLLPQLPFVEDVEKEINDLKAEEQEKEKRRAQAFGAGYSDSNEQDDEA